MDTLQPLSSSRKYNWLAGLGLLLVLALAAFLRFRGSDWGNLEHQHPDELFLTSVTYNIALPGADPSVLGPPPSAALRPWRAQYPSVYHDCERWGGYFDTACSPLNPHNRGDAFYAYGTLPIFMVRLIAELTDQVSNIKLLGRQMSAAMDVLNVLLIYLIALRLYNRRVALLAATFLALAVMPIQQSHFYTTDNFAVAFMTLATYFAVEILVSREERMALTEAENGMPGTQYLWQILSSVVRTRLFWFSVLFGIAFGMAMASKISAAPLAFLLPLAFFLRFWKREQPLSPETWRFILICLVAGGLAALLSFRLFQPYAFDGLGLNPAWLANIREQRAQATPYSDLPWNLQWARRTRLYSFQNLTVWGLGLPLGILAWLGFLVMAWRILRGEWRQHLLLWSWTAFYFTWQSLQYNPTMRYQLPIYPFLALMAAWVVFLPVTGTKPLSRFFRFALPALGAVVLLLTAGWALAFSSIYTRDEPRIAASRWIYENVPGPITLQVQTDDGRIDRQPLPYLQGSYLTAATPYLLTFQAEQDGLLNSVLLPHVLDTAYTGPQTLTLTLAASPDFAPEQVLASASLTRAFTVTRDPRGEAALLEFAQPPRLQRGQVYFLRLEVSGGALTLSGAAVINETDYDFTLPFRVDGYDGFGGLYRGDLNLQVYWDDNQAKLERFLAILEQGDYIFIPTNHQYGQITRLPERYPLTTAYYRALIGCPPERDIIWCYRVAEPGTFQGQLGFDLVATFTNYPRFGPIVINDQAAEEAFTFYDHPKVLIFQKRPDYDAERVRAILGAVDLSNVVRLLPGQADRYKSLMLPPERLAVQQAGGTWSELFDEQALQNRYPWVGLVLWYLLIFLVGVFAYPLTRRAFPGLTDGGYPLARIVGLLLWAWLAWLAGSAGIPVSRLTLGVALGALALLGAWLAWGQRQALRAEWGQRWKFYLFLEALFLAFFLLDLFIRLGNPDLWHPSKGGERPMNFAFLNAILKSTTFPPYDPWYAGGYINYYYFGYVIVGMPVKFLGIVPSIAYNFILPTLFACFALAAFSIGYHLVRPYLATERQWSLRFNLWPVLGGVSAAAAMVLLGNLGVVRLFVQGFQRLAAAGVPLEQANLFQKIFWTFKGFFLSLGGLNLPYGRGDWYWFATRIFPYPYGDFYEFPLFTFLYSDLHAHLIAYMLAATAIAWTLSLVRVRLAFRHFGQAVPVFFVGALVLGALKPTNTWDAYTYLGLAVVTLVYVVWRYADLTWLRLPFPLPSFWKRALVAGGVAVVLYLLARIFFAPFDYWFGLAYSSIEPWRGPRTPLSIYLTQWGVFLFFIVSWMAWETREWMASTPVSALRKLQPYRDWILLGLAAFFLFLVGQQVWVMLPTQTPPWKGITILWLALPLVLWAGILLLRPGLSDRKRFVLLMIGLGLTLTAVVELVVLRGDVGRMNTLYKFGVQSWILLGLSAAASFAWLLVEVPKWLPGWRNFWQIASTLLLSGAALVLLISGADKVRDRWIPEAPRTLDSMAFMRYAVYAEFGRTFSTNEDYEAIRWMLRNVQGSPVIVEAAPAGVQYTWLGRYSVYTGLPAVIGWQWHEQQQRVYFQGQVIQRGVEVDAFYTTTDIEAARAFLDKYNVRYIVVGQLERGKYAPGAPGGPVPADGPDGLAKFEQYDGVYWRAVFRVGETVIYEVIRE